MNQAPKKNSTGKPLLVLDLDETLIYSSKKTLYQKYSFKVFSYYIYERPELKKFLTEIDKFYSLAVWSAGADVYVEKIVERIFSDEFQLDFVWGRSKCNFLGGANKEESSNYLKNLHVLKNYNYEMEQVLILDDTPRVCMKNLNQAIFPKPFYGETYDDELYALTKYLVKIANEENFLKLDHIKWRKNSI